MTDQWDDKAREIAVRFNGARPDRWQQTQALQAEISCLIREVAAGQAAAPAWRPTHRHYKGGLYRSLHEALNSETMEWMTIYDDEFRRIWARPLAMFQEVLPDGTRRFTPLPLPPEPQG